MLKDCTQYVKTQCAKNNGLWDHEKALWSYNNGHILKANLIKKKNSHAKWVPSLRAICRPLSGLWTSQPLRLAGLARAINKWGEWEWSGRTQRIEGSAVSALWFRLCYYIIKFGLGSCFLRDYVAYVAWTCASLWNGPPFHEYCIRFRVYGKSELVWCQQLMNWCYDLGPNDGSVL